MAQPIQPDAFWLQDPIVLVEPDALFELWPSQEMALTERYNAIARLVILLALGIAVLLRSFWPLLIGAGVLALSVMVYNRKSAQLQAEQDSVKRVRRARRRYFRSNQPSEPIQTGSDQPLLPSVSEYTAQHNKTSGIIDRRPAPVTYMDSEVWRKFIQGPGQNEVNAGSVWEQRGINPSHGVRPQDFGAESLTGSAPLNGPSPNVGFGLDSSQPVGASSAVPDLQYSAVTGSFESKRLPTHGSFLAASGPPQQYAHPDVAYRASQAGTPRGPDPSGKIASMPGANGESTHGEPFAAAGQFPAPVCKPWNQLSMVEQRNIIERQQRDGFLDNLFYSLDEGLASRQFQKVPVLNELDAREVTMDAMSGSMTHFKDKFTSRW